MCNIFLLEQAPIKNNNIYIFAKLAAILDLCKLCNHFYEKMWVGK